MQPIIELTSQFNLEDRMKIKTVLGFAAVLGIAGGAVWGLGEWQKKSLPQPNQAWGSVDVREVNLAFEASGRIRTLLKE